LGSTPEAAAQITSTVAAAGQRATAAAADATREYHEAAHNTFVDAARQATLEALDALGVKTPPQVAQLYDFPANTDGSGECIAIIELGGGYDRAALEQYFAFLDIPMPAIADVSIAGGLNRPGISEPVDGEVCLDIEVIGGAAPGARLVCYFAPLTGLGFIEAIHAAVHDRVNRPSVISASWDLSEGFWLQMPGLVELMEEVLAEAALLGITVVCSAGDYGTPTTFHDGRAWVDYPASSPHVIACGGTTLASSGASIVAETVWNTSATMGQATGGGISQMFPVPAWQQHIDLPPSLNAGAPRGRGVPDVAANADPRTGYLVNVTGAGTRVICGTSSGAPLWAALIARVNQRLGTRVGFINPLLYESIGACRDVVEGDNVFWYGSTGSGFPGYRAARGWDAVTGWGSPSGTRLCEVLAGTG
jgi:kumamolisin